MVKLITNHGAGPLNNFLLSCLMSHRLLFEKMSVKCALDFQCLNSSNEDVYAISMLSNQGRNKVELNTCSCDVHNFSVPVLNHGSQTF